MTYEYAEVTHELPDTLADITLATIQAWSVAYGHELTLRGIEIAQLPATHAQLAAVRNFLHFMDTITDALSFFSDPVIAVGDVRSGMDLAEVIELLADTGISLAIQGPFMPIAVKELPRPATVMIDGGEYTVYSPLDSVAMEELTHEKFLIMLQLAEYLSELAEGDWQHFHILAAAFARNPGEELTDVLINPAGARATLFAGAINMAVAAPLAQLFIADAGLVLQILDGYTTQILTPPSP